MLINFFLPTRFHNQLNHLLKPGQGKGGTLFNPELTSLIKFIARKTWKLWLNL